LIGTPASIIDIAPPSRLKDLDWCPPKARATDEGSTADTSSSVWAGDWRRGRVYETFRAQVAERRDEQELLQFVERAFQDFLTCGCLAAGSCRDLCAIWRGSESGGLGSGVSASARFAYKGSREHAEIAIAPYGAPGHGRAPSLLPSDVVSSSLSYRPRQPEQGVLHQIVRDHYETFRARVAQGRDGQGLPQFVERAFEDFLTCGCLAAGFARFRCAACRQERLVAFSCKGRGFCPSCGGRRMTERAAHLVDHVFPDVPVRQWVLTLPSRVRYALAWDHALCRAVIAVYVRAVLGWYRRQARVRGVPNGRGGAVVIVQRFGSALNLNVHLHAMVLDGVFARDGDGVARFHAVSPDAPPDLSTLLMTIARRIQQLLVRRGIADDGDGVG